MTLEQELENEKILNEDYQKQIVVLTTENHQLHATISEERSLSRLLKKQLDEALDGTNSEKYDALLKRYNELLEIFNIIKHSVLLTAIDIGIQIINWDEETESMNLNKLEVINSDKVPPLQKVEFLQKIVRNENLALVKKILLENFNKVKIQLGIK
jgi:hypothetical protein